MKLKHICIVAATLPIAYQPLAQPADTGVKAVTQEEYASYMAGDITISDDIRMIYLEPKTPESVATDEKYTVHLDSTQGRLLQGKEAEAMAYLLFVKRLMSDINTIGTENSIRRYSKGYEISENEARGIVSFIQDVNQEYSATLQDAYRENCTNFLDDLERDGSQLAIEKMAIAEGELDSLAINYFAGIDARFKTSLPSHIFDNFHSAIESMQGNIRSTSINNLSVLEATGKDALLFFTDQCSHVFGSK